MTVAHVGLKTWRRATEEICWRTGSPGSTILAIAVEASSLAAVPLALGHVIQCESSVVFSDQSAETALRVAPASLELRIQHEQIGKHNWTSLQRFPPNTDDAIVSQRAIHGTAIRSSARFCHKSS